MYKQIIINHQPLNYAVFDNGQIYSISRHRYLDGNIDTKGYLTVHLSDHGTAKYYQVARLVAEAFIGKPKPGQQVIHLDNDKLNNHADNLRWVSSQKRILTRTELVKDNQSLTF